LWEYIDEEETDKNDNNCHKATFIPYQDNRKIPIKTPIADHSHPFYRYVTTNTRVEQSDNDTMDSTAKGTCNQLYSIVEETECQVREEVKTVNERMRRRKTGAYTAYVKHASFKAPADLPNIRIDMSKAQNDPGANRTITKHKELLVHYKKLKRPYTIGGIAEDEVALECWGVGYLPWKSIDGKYVMIRCFHSEQCDGTLISPNDVCIQHRNTFEGYATHCNVNGTGTGWIDLNGWDGSTLRFNMHMDNGLWFHHMETNINHQPIPTTNRRTRASAKTAKAKPSQQTNFDLWHHRLGHPGMDIMENIHKYANGVPRMRQDRQWKCESCMKGKFRKQHIGEEIPRKPPDRGKENLDRRIAPGQGLHMDFGFVRGKKWKAKDEDGKLITSLDGYRSYLLVVDHATRYKWVFLTKRKTPPIEQVERLLETLNCTSTGKFIMTDQGGELGKSFEFQQMIDRHKYGLRLTGAGSSEQNGRCERVHQDLARIMRCLLHGAGLGPEYWLFALIHATYLLNRWPHKAIRMSPYQAMFNKLPDLSHLRIFGAKVEIFKQDKQGAKLDHRSTPGIFLHYAGSHTNVMVQDSVTKSIKNSRHITWDKLHISSPIDKRPPMTEAIAGHLHPQKEPTTLRITPLTTNATMPMNNNLGGITISSAAGIELTPGETCNIPTDLALKCPAGTYARVGNIPESHHTLSISNNIIGNECRNLSITMTNHGLQTIKIHKNQKIATVLLEKPEPLHMEQTKTMHGLKGILKHTTSAKAAKLSDHGMDAIVLSNNPYDDEIDIRIPSATRRKRTNHPTMGIVMDICPKRGLPILSTIEPSTAAAKINRWRSTLRNGYILGVNNIKIPNGIRDPKERLKFIEELINKAAKNDEEVTIQMGLIEKMNLHPSEGVPIVYQDQIQTIGRHLHEIKEDAWFDQENNKEHFDAYIEQHSKVLEPNIKAAKGILPKSKSRRHKLTRRKLRMLPDDEWKIWKESEHKQLQQYEDQQTFGKPCPLPPGANCLPLLWTYLKKG
jgi:dUTPase